MSEKPFNPQPQEQKSENTPIQNQKKSNQKSRPPLLGTIRDYLTVEMEQDDYSRSPRF